MNDFFTMGSDPIVSLGVLPVLATVYIVLKGIRDSFVRNRRYKDFYDDSNWDEILEKVPKNRLSKSQRKKNSVGGDSYRKRNKYSLLLLGADTNVSNELGISRGFEQIQSFIKEKNCPCTCTVKMRTNKTDIIKEIAVCHPDILHFSGHGNEDGLLCVHGGIGDVEYIAPSKLFENLSGCCDFIQVVVLAACYSARQADKVAKVINFVVCVDDKICVSAIHLFLEVFYAALTSGSSIQEAFDLGVAQLKMNDPKYSNALRLVVKQGLDPKKLSLIPNKRKDKIKKEI